ncbi:MAG TPA: cation transporter, partial [Xanthomonadaceae bacterium]|nr:cation transporter [Xanthomonadaceae bacterium]
LSIYEGITHLRHPEPMQRPLINYAVLALSGVFEGGSWWVAMRSFRKAKGTRGWFEAFRASKDPSTFTVLFEDSAALLGLLIAAVGVAGSQLFQRPTLDGVASIGIGLVLCVAALLLARETKGLLIGESAHPRVRSDILRIAGTDAAIRRANGVFTVQLGPDSVVAALSAEFEDALGTPDIEQCVNRIEAAVRAAHPDVVALFVKPQTARTWQRRISRLHDDDEPLP